VLLPEARNHGRSDATVPLDDALELEARRGSATVQLCVVEGTHEQFMDEALLFETVQQFLARSLASAVPAPEPPQRSPSVGRAAESPPGWSRCGSS
jgi:anti-sigma factor RsiW